MGTPNDRFEYNPHGHDNASAESRTRFSEQASRPESVESVKYASDPADRKMFRQSCAQLLSEFHGELATANSDMRSANLLAANGQAGSQAYQQALQKAETSYKNAVLDSTAHLFQTDSTGAPVRDANGNPKPGDLFTAISKERAALGQEMNMLGDMAKNGQNLTAKQMQDLDVTTNNPHDAIAQIKQQDMALEDLRRSAGYAEANFGLALVRNSEYSQGTNKQQELSMAGSLLATAAKDDPFMLGHSNNPLQPASDADPNYLKSLQHVLQVANVNPSDLGAGATAGTGDNLGATANGGAPADRTAPVTDQSAATQAGNQQSAALTADQINSLSSAYQLYSQIEGGKQQLSNDTLSQLQTYLKAAQSIAPGQLQAEANREYGTLLNQGWTSQMEQQFKADNPQNLPLGQLQKTNAPAAQKLQSDFANNQQLLQARDAVAGNMQILANLQHAVPSIQAMVGTLLMDSGNAQQAQPFLDAAKGDQLAQQIPGVQAATQKIAQMEGGSNGTNNGTAGSAGDSGTAGNTGSRQAGDNTSTPRTGGDNTAGSNSTANQNAGTPMGYAQQADQLLSQAVKTATASGDALANFNSAKPMFQQAMNAAAQIDMAKVNQAQSQIGTQLQPLMQKLQSEPANQRSASDMQQFQQLQQQAAAVAAIRQEPDVVAFRYAAALNDVAVSLAAKGDKTQAKQFQDQAVSQLQDIAKKDPTFGGSQQIQLAVNGAIEAAQKGQKFNETQAAAMGIGQQADAAMQQGQSPFGVRFLQPAETSSNVVGSALMEAGRIPGIGIIPAAFGSSLAFGDKAAAASAQAIAMAKEVDPATGKAIVQQHVNSSLASGFGAASDIVAGTGGLAIAEKVAPMALVKMGLADSGIAGVVATGLIGLTGTTGIRKTLDMAQHHIFGTPEMSNSQLLTHSAADFGAAWAIKGIANMKANAATKALNTAEGLSADGSTITLKTGETVAADGKLTLKSGQVLDGASNRLKEGYLNLPETTQAKFDSAIAGRTNLSQQKLFDQLGKTVSAEQKDVAKTIFGRTNLARYRPFSFLRGADASELISTDAGSLAKPFALSGKARLAYMAGGGAAANSIFGLGSEDWSKPDAGKIGGDLLMNSATGAGAGVIGGVMAPWIAKFPLKQAEAIGGFAGKIADSNAGRVAMPAAKAFDTTGFWAMTGKATATRFGAGFGVGGTLGFVTHNPGSSESWKTAGEWGLAGGTALALGKPAFTTLDNYALRPVKNVAQNALNLGIRAPLGRVVDSATTKVAGDGTFISDQVAPRWNAAKLGVHNFMDKSVSPWTAIYGAPFALQISDSANGLFGAYEWSKVGSMSDQIVAADAKAAKQQQTASTDNTQAAAANNASGTGQPTDTTSAPTTTDNANTGSNGTNDSTNAPGTIGSMANGGG